MAENSKTDQQKKTNGTSAPQGPAGSTLPLFYKNPEPLEAGKHAGLSLRRNFGFGFTADVNAVPVNVIEMPQACHFYPIAFSPDGTATPVALLGLRDHENLFVDQKGQWEEGAYIPAYIRRYPFIFSEVPGKDQFTLCVDNHGSVVEKGGDSPFFDNEGKPTPLAKDALEFCKNYHAAAHQTSEFSAALQSSGLLIDREAQINLPGNRRISFSGFKIVSEKKFAEMDDKTFLEWRKKGWIAFIYAHLFSGSQWGALSRRLNGRIAKEAN